MLRFMIRFFNEKSGVTERHIIESHTIGQALKKAIGMTIGQSTRDLVIIQED